MLLDYAAQVKCRTTRHVSSTAVALSHFPSNLHHFLLNFSSHAHSLLLHLQAELHALTARTHQKARIQKSLAQTRRELRKATKLIQRGASTPHPSPYSPSPYTDEPLSPLGSDSTVSLPDDDDSASKAGSDSTPDPSIDLLQQQIRQLTEQMERFTQLTSVPCPPQEQEEEGREEVVVRGVDVPQAPPLTTPMFASIPIAAPMLPNPAYHSIPHAPPLTIPTAPALTIDGPSTAPDAPPLAPPFIPDAPSTPSSSRTPIPSRSILSDVTRHRTNAPPPVYTRNIPGADQLSHTDLIQVAARIKLRRTEVPRSPGGTPCKKVGGGLSGGMGLGEALRAKFRNAQGQGRGGMRGSEGRGGYAGGDKENDSWSTD